MFGATMNTIESSGRIKLHPYELAPLFGNWCPSAQRQRRLGHIALLGGAREIERPRNGEEIPDLMHLHDRAPT